MKIEIDTSKDSTEDIKKAIKMLQSIVGDYSERTYSSEDEPVSTGAFNMFGDDNLPENNEEPEEKEEPKVHVVEY